MGEERTGKRLGGRRPSSPPPWTPAPGAAALEQVWPAPPSHTPLGGGPWIQVRRIEEAGWGRDRPLCRPPRFPAQARRPRCPRLRCP